MKSLIFGCFICLICTGCMSDKPVIIKEIEVPVSKTYVFHTYYNKGGTDTKDVKTNVYQRQKPTYKSRSEYICVPEDVCRCCKQKIRK